MKQPKNWLEIFKDEDTVWVDVNGVDGGCGNVGVSEAKTEVAAYRKAAKRLAKLAKQAELKAEKLEAMK